MPKYWYAGNPESSELERKSQLPYSPMQGKNTVP